jgi:hypothetical protein
MVSRVTTPVILGSVVDEGKPLTAPGVGDSVS